jgi:hypothetical protein
MWADIVKYLAEYPSAVLTIVDDGGYPFSFRCKPEPDASSQTLRLQLPEGLSVKPGPAGILCHKHDELLFNMKSFGVSGTLEEDNRGWILRRARASYILTIIHMSWWFYDKGCKESHS